MKKININKKKIAIIVVIISIIIIVLYMYLKNNYLDEYSKYEEEVNNEEITNEEVVKYEEKEIIIVHISGEVVSPGVINLYEGARVIDAINAAGGTTQKADLNEVNLAHVIEDGDKIIIPNVENKENIIVSNEYNIVSSEKQTKSDGKMIININKASKEELQQLQGIGESIANRIIEYRRENGKFKQIEDLKNVKGIGESKYNKIKDNITL